MNTAVRTIPHIEELLEAEFRDQTGISTRFHEVYGVACGHHHILVGDNGHYAQIALHEDNFERFQKEYPVRPLLYAVLAKRLKAVG